MRPAAREKILNSQWTFIGAALLVGPLALPLLWRNPKATRTTKIVWTSIVIAFTVTLLWGSAHLTQMLLEITQP
jgi:putative exporter of polyketide antibiotics